MGMSVSHQRILFESIRNGEGSVDQQNRASKLIEEMRTSVPDFKEHSAVYTQLAKYLAKDENCTIQDVMDAYAAIKNSLKENGKNAEDSSVIATFNKFKTLVRDSDVNSFYQKADLKASDITEILKQCATDAFDKNAFMACLQNKPSNQVKNSLLKPQADDVRKAYDGKMRADQLIAEMKKLAVEDIRSNANWFSF